MIALSKRLISSGRNIPSATMWLIISSLKCESSLRCCTVFKISFAPALLVAMMMVLRAFTLLPRASVNTPSSRICKKRSCTSCAPFSNSSRSRTLYGCSRSMSGSMPECSFSPSRRTSASSPLNSDISSRCKLPSPPKKICASALAVSVFPTPVGPRNKNEPIGFSVS